MSGYAEPAAHALAYAYAVNSGKNEFIEKKMKIFEIQDGDLHIAPEAQAEGWIVYSDSKSSASKNFAAKMGVQSCYPAFSAAASMAISSSENFQTIRYDEIIRSSVFRVTAGSELQLTPHKRLTVVARDFLMKAPIEAIEDKIGIFVATACTLGGTFHKSLIMEATEQDRQASASAEAEASFKGVGGASFGFSYGQRSSNSSLKTKTSWKVEGGNAAVWQGLNQKNFEEVQKEWARTIVESNMFPSQMTLVPIWEVVQMLDADRASKLKEHLMKKWLADSAPLPSAFRPLGNDDSISSGDAVSLRNPSHENEFVECNSFAGGGYGVSTYKEVGSRNGHANNKFMIHKFSGATGKIESGDAVYLRNPSHGNHYVECDAREGGGFGVSTRDNKDVTHNGIPKAKFTIHKI